MREKIAILWDILQNPNSNVFFIAISKLKQARRLIFVVSVAAMNLLPSTLVQFLYYINVLEGNLLITNNLKEYNVFMWV